MDLNELIELIVMETRINGLTMMPLRHENNLAREIVVALAESNLLNPALKTNTNDRAMEAMREFSRRNPPMFDGASSDPLVVDHWLAQIRKLFRALKITKDDLRVNIVAVQLTGEANEWWESILELRKDLRNQFERLEQENMTMSEYARRFQSLSRFAPELVATEERKCRHFEKGLHSSVKLLVASQRIGKFSKIILLSVRGVRRFR
ncbi:uncharacterized protein LOC131323850 [Rhododendron vialii]|uniref:uncharacterized protein LOC131323850 n=1 Tax=Rhododendron vialii TaxID=182163 RepID=UPI00265ECE57|nr:uncharacterized protein LOC131323850 [Rhododendron vialii]